MNIHATTHGSALRRLREARAARYATAVLATALAASLAVFSAAPASAADVADEGLEAVLRVNAGGDAIPSTDGGPDWQADTDAEPSPLGNGVADSGAVLAADAAVTVDPSMTAPAAVFDTARVAETDPLTWLLTPDAGDYTLRVYLAEIDPSAQAEGSRVFDIEVDGVTVVPALDVFASATGYTAAQIDIPVTSDGDIEVSLVAVSGTAAPMVSGLELLVPLPDPATLAASATELTFGDVETGATDAQTITLTNTGGTDATVASVDAPSPFGTDLTAGTVVPAGGSIDVEVSYSPTLEVADSATLTIDYGGASTVAVALSGTGVAPAPDPAPAELDAGMTSLDLGTVEPGQTATATFTLSNLGEEDATIALIDVASPFSTDLTTGTVVPAGGSVEVEVTYAPTAEGADGTDLLIGYGTLTPFALALAGEAVAGLAPAELDAGTATLDLGTVEAGQTATATFTLSNLGEQDATVAAADAAAPFSTDLSVGTVVPAGGSVDVEVTYAPTAEGTDGADLTIEYGAATPVVVGLAGEAVAAPAPAELVATPDTVDLGTVTVGGTAGATVTVSNLGDVDATLSDATVAAPFASDAAAGLVVPAGGSVDVAVSFTPVAEGPDASALVLTYGGAAPLVVSLTGTGAAAPTYALLVSGSPTREPSTPLDAAELTGAAYVFMTTPDSVIRVRFWIDDPTMSGAPYRTENNAPYDLAGGSVNSATAFDTATLADGPHTITAAATTPTGELVTITGAFTVTNVVAESDVDILVSHNPQRTLADLLQGQEITGPAYIFTAPDDGVAQVAFWLDDPTMSGGATRLERNAPYDLAGGSPNAADAWDSTTVADGAHTLTARVSMTDGSYTVITSTFTVNNSAPTPTIALLSSDAADRSAPLPLSDRVLQGSAYIFTSPDTNVRSVRFYLDDPTMSGSAFRVEGNAPFDFAGGSVTAASPWDTYAVSDGIHTITALVTLTTGALEVVNATFEVANGSVTTEADIFHSYNAQRTAAQPLEGLEVTGDAYIFTGPDEGVAQVAFWIDDPTMTGGASRIENNAPYDLFGGSPTEAAPWDTTTVPDGTHTVTARLRYADGTIVVTTSTFTVANTAPSTTIDILRSDSPTRTSPVPLDGTQLTGDAYIFTGPDAGVTRVGFWLDDATASGFADHTESGAPFDFINTAANGFATAWDTTTVADGVHTITVVATYSTGRVEIFTAEFVVANTMLVTDPTETFMAKGKGDPATSSRVVVTSPDGGAPVVTATATPEYPGDWLSIVPVAGSSPAAFDIVVDATDLTAGLYEGTVVFESPGWAPTPHHLAVSIEGSTTNCGPLTCGDVLVETPYGMDFSESQGGIVDKNGIGTGFTWFQRTSKGTGYIPGNLEVDPLPVGDLAIDATRGLAFLDSNNQDNALGVGIDALSHPTLIQATIVDVPAGTGQFQQAGIWFGLDEDNYIKLAVQSSPVGLQVAYTEEYLGELGNGASATLSGLAGSDLKLRFLLDSETRLVASLYAVDDGPWTPLLSHTLRGEFFGFDAAGTDPAVGTRTFAGILTSARHSTAPITFRFGDFLVDNYAGSPGAPDFPFLKQSYGVSMPTAMQWGPDDRLYVTEAFGDIHALTFDDNWNVIDDQVSTALGTRLTLGIAIDPASTPDNVILYAAHSDPVFSHAAPNSGVITRISGADMDVAEDVITGLPRGSADHSVNNIHFDDAGQLFIAVGGNTGAGAPNTSPSEFGDRPEQPLSAALLVADVNAPGFQGECATPLGDGVDDPPEAFEIPATCDVAVYSSGLRNMYDFVLHSNGEMYGPVNGLGVQGTYPTSAVAPCTGLAPWPANDPGTQPDYLMHLQAGGYYGHPNPYRNECVFFSGEEQGATPPANYVEPIYNFGNNRSANGIIEYTGDSFCGALNGDLLVANYSVGDFISRLTPSADGGSIVDAGITAYGFNDPLPLAMGPQGVVFVGEFGGGRVTVLTPDQDGCWTPGTPVPQGILDAGGTSIGDVAYMIAGKTGAGPLTTVRSYDASTDTWATLAPLPGTAVENPAVTTAGGLVYVFGGSTEAFAGGVSDAAVYDPAANAWTVLTPMPTARGGARAEVIGGTIYVVGGMAPDGTSLPTVEAYDIATNTWSTLASLTTRRDNAGSGVANGLLYVFGGRVRNADGSVIDNTLTSMEVYDPATGTWTAGADMPTGRRAMSVGFIDGKFQVVGGESPARTVNEEYDPATGLWRTLAPIPVARHGGAAATIGTELHIFGGSDDVSPYQTRHDVFTYSD